LKKQRGKVAEERGCEYQQIIYGRVVEDQKRIHTELRHFAYAIEILLTKNKNS